MALTTESALFVKEKALRMSGVPPATQILLKGLFSYLAQHKSNPELYFEAFSDLTADQVISDAACKVYAIYMKKQATATGAFFKASDHATATSATAAELVQELPSSGDEFALLYPNGWAQGTGFTIGSDTTADGNTSSTSGDGPNGFVIVGKP